jgi:hypothetical protein
MTDPSIPSSKLPGWSPRSRSFWIATLNMGLSIAAIWLLMHQMHYLKNNRVFANEKVETVQDTIWITDSTYTLFVRTIITTLPASETASVTANDTSEVQLKGTYKTDTKNKPEKNTPISNTRIRKANITFYDVLLMMLIAGALGGVLCNLRGIFSYYRDENQLPEELHIPYLTRPFTAAVCGIFIYFVASLLITSITLVPSESVGFQGMITYMALAIVAGFGAQEFMERLKALAVTLFGEKQQDTMMQRLRQISRLKEKGVIDEEEFLSLKKRIISDNTASKVLENLQQLQTFAPPPTGGQG